jgi:VanZ family protein
MICSWYWLSRWKRVYKAAMMPVPMRNLFRLTLLVTVLVITYLATAPLTLPATLDVSDKLLHGLAFLVVLWLADYSWPDTRLTLSKLGFVFTYGVLIEVVQYFLPYRDFSLADMLADALGMGLYPLIVPLLQRLPLLGLRWTL